jgi:hypothetical protein
MQTTNTNNSTITIKKTEYDALIHTAEVTAEYLSGQVQKFSPEDLIANLKAL